MMNPSCESDPLNPRRSKRLQYQQAIGRHMFTRILYLGYRYCISLFSLSGLPQPISLVLGLNNRLRYPITTNRPL